MTTLNAYATLQEYKNYARARSGDSMPPDTVDDSVLEMLLKDASELLNNKSGRKFYPFIETRYYDVPENRTLELDEDLLEVLTLTNGDGTVIPSTEYTLQPRNQSPYRKIRLIDTSSYYWTSSTNGGTYDAISLSAIWGYHKRYAKAWLSATTISEDLDTSETGVDVTTASPFVIGDLTRIDNEFGYIYAIASITSLTSTRGENGSTAASHSNTTAIKIWQVMTEAKNAVLEIAKNADARRFGQSQSNTATITAAGIVLSPRDIPASAWEFIKSCRGWV